MSSGDFRIAIRRPRPVIPRNLLLKINSHLSFNNYITSIYKSINYNKHILKLIRSKITTNIAKLLITALLPKLDYCNIVSHELPNCTLLNTNFSKNNSI